MIFIVEQVYIFLYAVLAGAIAAFLYDILRIKRRAIKTSVIIVGLEDILYWLVAAVFLFITVYKTNSGEMRGYIFIGNVIGVALYESLLSRIIIASSVMIINLVKKILLFIWKVLSYPFKILFKLIAIPVAFIFKLARKSLRFIGGKSKVGIKRAGSGLAGGTRILGTKVKVLGAKAGKFTGRKINKITRRPGKKKMVEKSENKKSKNKITRKQVNN